MAHSVPSRIMRGDRQLLSDFQTVHILDSGRVRRSLAVPTREAGKPIGSDF